MNGKLYIVFGNPGINHDYDAQHKTIERLDVKAHIQGQSVDWEQWELPLEHLKLMFSPVIAPISDTEIVAIRFGTMYGGQLRDRFNFQINDSSGRILNRSDDGGVAIYNVETRSLENVGNFDEIPTQL